MQKLLLFLSCLLPLSLLQAQTTTEALAPYFQLSEQAAFPLLCTDTKVEIDGIIAKVELHQVYINKGEKAIEANYVFPGSTQAAVNGMKLQIGERSIQAEIQERAKAQKNYQAARQAGKRAALLEQDRPNIFQMHVANILPGDTVRTILSYTEILIPEEGQYEWVLPTVVGPRYTGEEKNNQQAVRVPVKLAAPQGIPYLPAGVDSELEMGLEIYLKGATTLQSVESPSHRLQTEWKNKSETRIVLHPTEARANNRDFILRYRLREEAIQSGLMLYEGAEEKHFTLLVQPPERITPEKIAPREYLFLLDVSGSMLGSPLELAKKVMNALLEDLRPQDRFNILAFSGGSAWWNPQSAPVNRANVTRALEEVSQLGGGGGTHMLAALQKAMANPKEDGYARSFVILTDGYVSVEAEAFQYLREHLDEANFFTFGIGSSVNRYLLEGLARAGQGAPFMVTAEGEEEALVQRFRDYVEAPVLTDIRCDFPGWEVYDLQPPAIPDLLGERPLVIMGKYRGKPGAKISLSGKQAGKDFSQTVNSKDATTASEAIAQLWARQRIQSLQDEVSVGSPTAEEKIAAITKLGLKYSLLTKYTSFVAIGEEVVNPGGVLNEEQQVLEMPEGVSNTALSNVQYFSQSAAPEFKAESAPPPPPPRALVEEDAIFQVVEQMPIFHGCSENTPGSARQNCSNKAIVAFFKQKIKWPHVPDYSVSGTIILSFVVKRDGSIKGIQILRGLHPKFDQEVIRVAKLMPKWQPGTQNGRPVEVQYNFPIRVEL